MVTSPRLEACTSLSVEELAPPTLTLTLTLTAAHTSVLGPARLQDMSKERRAFRLSLAASCLAASIRCSSICSDVRIALRRPERVRWIIVGERGWRSVALLGFDVFSSLFFSLLEKESDKKTKGESKHKTETGGGGEGEEGEGGKGGGEGEGEGGN